MGQNLLSSWWGGGVGAGVRFAFVETREISLNKWWHRVKKTTYTDFFRRSLHLYGDAWGITLIKCSIATILVYSSIKIVG